MQFTQLYTKSRTRLPRSATGRGSPHAASQALRSADATTSRAGPAACAILPIVRKTVDLIGVLLQLHGDAVPSQPPGVRLAFTAQDVVAVGQDEGGRGAGQIRGLQWRDAPILGIGQAPQIVIVKSLHRRASEQLTLGKALVARDASCCRPLRGRAAPAGTGAAFPGLAPTS